MNKTEYIDLLNKVAGNELSSFNETTSECFIRIFLHMIKAVMLIIFLLIISVFILFIFNNEYFNYVVKTSNYLANSVMPFSIILAICSIRHKNGKTISVHKWIYKNHVKKYYKKKVQSNYISTKQFDLIKELIEGYSFDKDLNKINFNDILVFNILKKIKADNILHVVKLGNFNDENSDNENIDIDIDIDNDIDGKIQTLKSFWKNLRFITYWREVIENNKENYQKYESNLYSVNNILFFVYENKQIDDVIDDIKNILKEVSDQSEANVKIEAIFRKMNLNNNLVIKDDVIKVRKKI